MECKLVLKLVAYSSPAQPAVMNKFFRLLFSQKVIPPTQLAAKHHKGIYICVYVCIHTYTIYSTTELLARVLWRAGYQFSLWNKHIVRMKRKKTTSFFAISNFVRLGHRSAYTGVFKAQVITIKGPGVCLWTRLGAFNHERE